MGIFDKLFRKSPPPAPKPWTAEDLWELQDERDLMYALNRYLHKKCQAGKHMELLSPCEQTLYVTWELEDIQDTYSGSIFDHLMVYFVGPETGGDHWPQLEAALETIGAKNVAHVYRKMLKLTTDICGPLPTDSDARWELTEEHFSELESAKNKLLLEPGMWCEDLYTLRLAYAQAHKSEIR